MMKCEIVRDLIPLCIDRCSSEESEALVREHMVSCSECREIYEAMEKEVPTAAMTLPAFKENPVNPWKVTLLQSGLFFLAFGMIVLGVFLEWRIPSGLLNGNIAISFVVPVTAFLLALLNWNFIRLYKSRVQFQRAGVLVFFLFALGGDIFAAYHYGFTDGIFEGATVTDIFEILLSPVFPFCLNIIITALVGCALFFLSKRFALLVGRE